MEWKWSFDCFELWNRHRHSLTERWSNFEVLPRNYSENTNDETGSLFFIIQLEWHIKTGIFFSHLCTSVLWRENQLFFKNLFLAILWITSTYWSLCQQWIFKANETVFFFNLKGQGPLNWFKIYARLITKAWWVDSTAFSLDGTFEELVPFQIGYQK